MNKERKEGRKKGVSPIVAVILMVAITVVMAATVYIWVSHEDIGQQQEIERSITMDMDTGQRVNFSTNDTILEGEVTFNNVMATNCTFSFYTEQPINVTVEMMIVGIDRPITIPIYENGTQKNYTIKDARFKDSFEFVFLCEQTGDIAMDSYYGHTGALEFRCTGTWEENGETKKKSFEDNTAISFFVSTE